MQSGKANSAAIDSSAPTQLAGIQKSVISVRPWLKYILARAGVNQG